MVTCNYPNHMYYYQFLLRHIGMFYFGQKQQVNLMVSKFTTSLIFKPFHTKPPFGQIGRQHTSPCLLQTLQGDLVISRSLSSPLITIKVDPYTYVLNNNLLKIIPNNHVHLTIVPIYINQKFIKDISRSNKRRVISFHFKISFAQEVTQDSNHIYM